jgi:uncharacterized repeat protein (TIGR02543 family)
MKKNKFKLKGLWVIALTLLLTLALFQTALAAEINFPLNAKTGELVANENTKYIIEFTQDAATKFITASVKIHNGNVSGGAPLKLHGVSFEISFTGDVALYRYNPLTDGTNHPYNAARMYTGGINLDQDDFRKYCHTPLAGATPDIGFATIDTNAFKSTSDPNGRFIGAAIVPPTENYALTVAPNTTVTVAQVFFMPVSSSANNILDRNMFDFKFINRSADTALQLKTLSNWLGNGEFFLISDRRAVNPAATTFVMNELKAGVSQSFELQVLRDAPSGLSANNTSRLINAYNDATMEWSDSITGPFQSAQPAGGFGNTARTVYARLKADDNYTGSDAVLGNYKREVAPTVAISFTDVTTGTDWVVTFKGNGGSPDTLYRYVPKTPVDGMVANIPTGTDVTRTDYRLIGWNTAANGSGTIFDATTRVNRDYTVYAQWDPIINPPRGWSLTFNCDGGYFDNGSTTITKTGINPIKMGEGDFPTIPKHSGNYKFDGWFWGRGGADKELVRGADIPDPDHGGNTMTVYAKWTYIGNNDPYTPPGGGSTIFDPDVPLAGFTADHIPFISGYPDNTVKPDNAITRAEVAMIFFRLLTDPDKNSPRSSVFSDVKDTSWYAAPVNYLASIKILEGYPEGTFGPDRPITRAEFAAVASRFDKLEDVETNAFPDVEDHWAKVYINSAYAKGWVNGYPEDGTFRPQRNITRAEVVKVVNTMLNRRLRISDLSDDMLASIKKFSDVETHWAYAEIVEASNNHDYTRNSDGYETWTILK